MRTLRSHALGGPATLQFDLVPDPVAGPGEIRIAVRACGLNFPDTLTIRGLYQVDYPRPFSPGAEVAGIVDQVGEGVDHIAEGDEVLARCGTGGLSEHVVVSAARALPMPRTMQMTKAAGFLFTYSTAYHALTHRAAAHPGETLLVLGAAGGVGSAACEVGKALGLRVIAAASSEEKLAFACRYGADVAVRYDRTVDPGDVRSLAAQFRAAAAPSGIDIVCDPVGGAHCEAALRALNPDGRLLVVGFTGGIAKPPLNLVLLKSCSIIGVNWRHFTQADTDADQRIERALLDLHAAGALLPREVMAFPFDQAREALQVLEERSAMGKVVVTF